MIPLPAAPTDNLFKFICISGLLSILAWLILPSFVEQQRLDMAYQLRKENEEKRRAMVFGIATIFNGDPEMQNRERRIEIQRESGKHVQAKIDSDFQEMEAEIDRRSKVLDGQVMRLNLAACFGIILMIAGLIPWWLRAQRLQDRLLVAQLAEAEFKAKNYEQPDNTKTSESPRS